MEKTRCRNKCYICKLVFLDINMEEKTVGIWPVITVIAIIGLIIGSIFLYIYLERGLDGFIDWFADRIIGVMFAGLLSGAFVLFDKLSNKKE